MESKVGLGVVGLGWWGKKLAETIAATGIAEVSSCYARREEGRQAFAAQHGCTPAPSYQAMLEDPAVEGVLIATSHQSHRSLIEQAASAGKPVFVEKPLATTVEDATAAVEAAERAGIALQVGHQRRRTAANRRIRRLIEEGALGELEVAEGRQSIPNGFTMAAEAWRWNADESPLGSMTSLGIHKIDTMHYLVGPIRSVFCFTRPGRAHSIDEATSLALEFECGVVGTLVSSFFTPRISEISVYGQDAAAFGLADGARLAVQRRGEPITEDVPVEPTDPVLDQMTEFARVVRGEADPEVGGRQGLEVVLVLAAGVESARTRRAVDLADLR